jgi:hypothetical protein
MSPARRTRRATIALRIGELVVEHGVDGAAERIGVTPRRFRRWRRVPLHLESALERRLSELPRARVRHVLPPYVVAPGYLDFRRALIGAQLDGRSELVAELVATLEELRSANRVDCFAELCAFGDGR